MLIIREENENKNNFYERTITTQNDLFLCKSKPIKLNESNREIVKYVLDEKKIEISKEKLKKILEKIENNDNNKYNIKYYNKYFEVKKKIRILYNKKYKKIVNNTKEILYGGKHNKLLNNANNRRLKNNRSII